MTPSISIIVPCLNAETHIAAALESVRAQSLQEYQIIVVDNGSTDRTREIVETRNDPHTMLVTETQQGVSAARNRGLKLASGEFVAFLDADDYWHANALELLYAALRDNPRVALAYCGWQNVGLPGGAGSPYVPPDYEQVNKWKHLLTGCPWPIHAALTRRSAVLKAGTFDTSFATSEDYKLWLNIASVSSIVRVPKVLAYYRHHGITQATGNKMRLALEKLKVQEEFMARNPQVAEHLSEPEVRKLIVGGLLQQAYEAYWRRDLDVANTLFRTVMKKRYGSAKDWLYMLPSLLPTEMQRRVIRLRDRQGETS